LQQLPVFCLINEKSTNPIRLPSGLSGLSVFTGFLGTPFCTLPMAARNQVLFGFPAG